MIPLLFHCTAVAWRLTRAWALVSVLLGGALSAWAQPALLLQDERPVIDAWPQVRLWAEPGDAMSADQVLARLADFAPPSGAHANLGVRREVVWLHLLLEVPASGRSHWILDVDYPAIDRLDVYAIRAGRAVALARLGDHQPAANRPLQGRSLALPLDLEPGRRHELLLRVETTSSMILPLTLIQPQALHARETAVHAGQGVLAGLWLCLLVYSLAQWAGVREVIFAYYGLTIAGTGMFFLAYCGLGPVYLWGGSDWLTRNAAPLGVLLSVAGGLLFVGRALDAPSIGPRVALAVRVLATVTLLIVLAFLLGVLDYRGAHKAATIIGLSPMLLAVPMAYVRLRQGDRAAGYMLLGWLIYAIGAFFQTLLLRGMLPWNFWNQNAYQLCSAIEMMLWMLVLGIRLNQMRTAAERASLERDHMSTLARSDALTGLLNRRGLTESVEPLLLEADRQGQLTAVYMLDLDGFKPINDTHGHDVGDELLVGVAARLQAQVRASDQVARLGGDEFLVVATNLGSEAQAELVGRKLLDAFSTPFNAGGIECRVGLTAGFALAPRDGQVLAELIKRADLAMYAAKQAGKGRLMRCAPPTGQPAT